MNQLNRNSTFQLTTLFVAVLLVVIWAYWPGLSGAFVFDDFAFIVGNPEMQVNESTLGAWVRAALSFPADHQGRWLSMLTFAANHYLHGLDPFGYKLTNLAIHIANGILVFFAMRALLSLWRTLRPSQALPQPAAEFTALAIAAFWLALPINLTAVLYVSQRLESLSNLFVFIGLFWYATARNHVARTGKGYASMWLALAVSTPIGLLAKESAILLPLYTACIELAFFRDTNTAESRRRIAWIYGSVLAVPLIAGLYWLSTWVGTENSYTRPFSTSERLMTEARIMVHYIHWVLLPLPGDLTLYHDNIRLSTGALSPPTTLLSILFIAATLAFAWLQRGARPLVSIGILWFFSGHLLTGTIIPLELVFEHRNYYPALGLVLAVVSASATLAQQRRAWATFAACGVLLFSLYLTFTAWRARDWSDPLRLAATEATLSPDSPRSQYELAYALLNKASDDLNSPLRKRALEVLKTCSQMSDAQITCDGALVTEAARDEKLPPPGQWVAIAKKLSSAPPSVTDFNVLSSLFRCQQQGQCYYQPKELGLALDAASSHPEPSPLLIDLKAQYLAFFIKRPDMAIPMFREVIRRQPNAPNPRANLIRVLMAFGDTKTARVELRELERMNVLGSLDAMIETLGTQIAAVEQAQRSKPPHG